MTIEIVHMSDTHLGYNELDRVTRDGVNAREQDFYDSFAAVIDRILELKPAAVMHTGDFFHRPSPANRPLILALAQLKRLEQAGIPFVVISGNHSTPRTAFTSPILKAFKSLDNLYPMFEQRYDKIEIGDIIFHGIPHINDEEIFAREIAKAVPAPGRINILMLHASVGKDYLMEEYGERVFPVSMYDHLKGFNYVALGHWHNFQKIERAGNAWYSGSTERLSDREAGKDKGFVRVLFDSPGAPEVIFEPIDVRKWHRLDIKNCSGRSAEDIFGELKGLDSEEARDAIISIYLHDLDPAQSIDFSNRIINDLYPEALVVQVRRFIKRDSGNEINFAGIETLEDQFMGFLDRSNEDEKEIGKLKRLASGYFDLLEQEER